METTNHQIEKNPKVSVCVLAYNHEEYIEQCLQSIVTQEATFHFEVIVGVDFSTDGTRAIVAEFAEKYPSILKAMFHETNIGGTRNYLLTHNFARGEYVAHIDGDDLMLPGKIQLQADFLTHNPEIVAVWHRVKIITADYRIVEPAPSTTVVAVSQRTVLQYGNAGVHSSMMYRRERKPVFETSKELLDLHISVEMLRNGGGAKLPNVLGIYRQGVGAMASNRKRIMRLVKEYLDSYVTAYPQFRVEINRCAFSLFVLALLGCRLREAIILLETFAMSFNIRTPLSVVSEITLLTRKAVTRLAKQF